MNDTMYQVSSQKTNIRRYRPNITGTANINTAHVLRELEKTTKTNRRPLANHFEQELDNADKFSIKLAFERSTDKKILAQKMHDHMERVSQEFQENLIKRREKLRALLESENHYFKKEVIEQNVKSEALKKLELKSKNEIEEEKESKNNQLEAAAKRMQQYLVKSPEVRDVFVKKSTIDTKYCNLAQIEQKNIEKQTEKEMEEMWHKISLEKMAEKEREAEEIAKRKAQSKVTVANVLKRQIMEKLALQEEEMKAKEDERKRLEELMEKDKCENLNEIQKRQEERRKLKSYLDNQLELAKKRLAEHVAEEAALDKQFASLDEDVQNEKMKLKMSSKALHNELQAYMQSLKEFRERKIKEDLELNLAISKIAKEAEEKRDQVKIKEKEARRREMQRVLEVRAKQLKEKQEQKERESKQRAIEEKLMEEERKSEENLIIERNKSKRLNALRYGQELKMQKEHTDKLRQKELEEIELMYKRNLQEEEEYQNIIQKLINSPQLSTPHGCIAQIDELKKQIDLGVVRKI